MSDTKVTDDEVEDTPDSTQDMPKNDDPDKAELDALRKEKADKLKAEQDAKDAELEELRKEKQERDAKAEEEARKPKAPAKKVEKPSEDKKDEPPAKKKRRVSRLFGDHYDGDEED